MSEIEENLRKSVAELLRAGQVKFVIGYEAGPTRNSTRPCFVDRPEESAKLVWNENCRLNLTRYLPGTNEKIGIVVKGCDGRALVELIKENQVKRENMRVIAPECSGVSSATPVGSTSGVERTTAEHCRQCRVRISPISDILLRCAKQSPPSVAEPSEAGHSPRDSKTSWLGLFRECIKCMACVKACPLCYCVECVIGGQKPILVSKLRMPDELLTFHLIRGLHMAGRCTECGACESACPVGIPLTRFYSQLNKEFNRIANYTPGMDLESKSPVKMLEIEGVVR